VVCVRACARAQVIGGGSTSKHQSQRGWIIIWSVATLQLTVDHKSAVAQVGPREAGCGSALARRLSVHHYSERCASLLQQLPRYVSITGALCLCTGQHPLVRPNIRHIFADSVHMFRIPIPNPQGKSKQKGQHSIDNHSWVSAFESHLNRT
jgi:hypothetical protein